MRYNLRRRNKGRDASVDDPPQKRPRVEVSTPDLGPAEEEHGSSAAEQSGNEGSTSADVELPTPPLDVAGEQHGPSVATQPGSGLQPPTSANPFSSSPLSDPISTSGLLTPDPKTPDQVIQTPPPVKKTTTSTKRYRNDNFGDEKGLAARIVLEARGVSRRDVPRATFVDRYMLAGLPAPREMRRAATAFFQEGTVEKQVTARIKHILRLGLEAVDASQRLPFRLDSYVRSDEPPYRCYGLPTKPDLSLARIDVPGRSYDLDSDRPHWMDIHFLVEHTSSKEKARRPKQMQLARNAWHIFAHQPSRERLFGLVVIDRELCWSYIDHNSIVYSEFFPPDEQLATEVMAVLSNSSLLTGHDYRVDYRAAENEVFQTLYRERDLTLRESEIIYYRPCLIGRHCRISALSDGREDRILKSAWEECISKNEAQVYEDLEKQGVRGILKKYWSASDIVTTDIPAGILAFPLATNGSLETTIEEYNGSTRSKSSQSFYTDEDTLSASDVRRDFNTPIQMQRRHVQLVLSRCDELLDFSEPHSVEEISNIFRDAMLCYYEVWKVGGYLQGDITPHNIMRTRDYTQFSHPSDRKVTIVDFNLCYNSEDSGRERRSGSPPYMAYALFDRMAPKGRQIGHDLESFFYVLVYVFTFRLEGEWHETPLYELSRMGPRLLASTKLGYFYVPHRFETLIFRNFNPPYQTNANMQCMMEWRRRIFQAYDGMYELNSRLDEAAHEEAFKACLVALDRLVGDDRGANEFEEIRQRAPKS